MRRCSTWSVLLLLCMIQFLVGSAIAYAHAPQDGSPEPIKLRVPGTTVHFELAPTPSGTIMTDEQEISITAMLVLTTEVSWDLYDIFVFELDKPNPDTDADAISRPSKPYVPPDRGFGHDGYPAIGMTRKAAEQFCVWLTLKLGVTVRLPEKQEWIYLAQGDLKEQPKLDESAWYQANSDHTTHPVAQKRPNGFGLYDVLGNAAEWVITDTRPPYAMGGGYRDAPEDSTVFSAQKQVNTWNQSDPQIPKSQWWLADCSWVGFRFVIDATEEHLQTLEELHDD